MVDFQGAFERLREALGIDIGTGGGLCGILAGIEDVRAERDQLRADLAALRARAEKAEAERDAARERLAKVVEAVLAMPVLIDNTWDAKTDHVSLALDDWNRLRNARNNAIRTAREAAEGR